MRFQIRRSINNIYSAVSIPEGKEYPCRIKGKFLKGSNEYNPVAVGDVAIGEPYSPNEALITEIEERRSGFTRWNVKAFLNQTIASNQDQTAIVLSSVSPPFRPRFVDRAIASSWGADILLIMNKADFGLDEFEEERWDLYRELGYSTISVSSLDGSGIEELKEKYLKGRTTAFVGQSGVGKSTLINTLMGTNQRTGDVSDKFNRGRHTTNHSIFLPGDDFNLIDTPGVREIQVPLEENESVKASFPELRDPGCLYPDCLHRGEEGCVVPDMVENGTIHYDRYESYLRILESLDERRPLWSRKGGKDGRKNY